MKTENTAPTNESSTAQNTASAVSTPSAIAPTQATTPAPGIAAGTTAELDAQVEPQLQEMVTVQPAAPHGGTSNSPEGNSSSLLTAEVAPSNNAAQPSTHVNSSAQPLGIMPLAAWTGSVTVLQGFTGTRPFHELEDGSWGEVTELLRPNKPAVLTDKKQGWFFLPCLLKEAPLVGRTLEAAVKAGGPITGKMRSRDHVTEASLLIMDVDGMSAADFGAARDKIESGGITYIAYTTFSHGSAEKPGVRARLVVPQDRPLGITDYSAAWHGFDEKYLGGAAGKADASGANMYQQQGSWCCHPERIKEAEFWEYASGVASADVLIGIGQLTQAVQTPLGIPPSQSDRAESSGSGAGREGGSRNSADSEYPDSDANKIADACQQIGAFRDSKGAGQSEPLWRDNLGVVGHCVDGEITSQEWSSGHPGYDEAATAKKLAQRLKAAPTTCAQFRKTNPEGCIGCTQTCKSPITLGWAAGALSGFAVVETTVIESPTLPAPVATAGDIPVTVQQGAVALAPLAAMQQQFCLLKISGRVWILERCILTARTGQGVADKLVLSNRSDGNLLIQRALKAQFPDEEAAGIVKEFWISPLTICYGGVEFSPAGTSKNWLNLWIGPTIAPKSGQWVLIEEFLRFVICDGDDDSYQYLICFTAHALQRPWEKPGVLIVMIGGQGTGKGTVSRILCKIWSATHLQVHNIDSVTGNFNAALERAYIVFMDEALFVGNRRASDALKSLVTEPVLHINEKHQPARQSRSYHRFFAATNAEHFKHTERDDRRDFILRVSESRKGNHAYWQALNREIDNGGVEAFAYDLLAMDLSGFNVRNKPNTKALLEQKLQSLEPIPRWWHDYLSCDWAAAGAKWPAFMSTEAVINGVVEMAGGKLYRRPAAIDVVQVMARLCPSASKMQRQQDSVKRRGFSLPPLDQARAEFEQYIGGVVAW